MVNFENYRILIYRTFIFFSPPGAVCRAPHTAQLSNCRNGEHSCRDFSQEIHPICGCPSAQKCCQNYPTGTTYSTYNISTFLNIIYHLNLLIYIIILFSWYRAYILALCVRLRTPGIPG